MGLVWSSDKSKHTFNPRFSHPESGKSLSAPLLCPGANRPYHISIPSMEESMDELRLM